MEPFAGIGHDDLLKLLITVAVLLLTARLLGQLMRRIGQPVILGELLAGVLLGPAFLAGLVPWVARWVVPATEIQSQLLDVVAVLGVLFLMMVVGMETDLALIRRHSRPALSIGLMGFLVPFGLGLGVAGVFPDRLLGSSGSRLVFALFLAVALALSAIPVLAKILSDLHVLRSPFGQVVLAAGMFDDLIGWTALGLVTSLATAGRVMLADVALTVGAVAVFFAVSYLIGRPGARLGLRFFQGPLRMSEGLIGFMVAFGLIWAAVSHALHLEPVLGAFVAGIILGRQRSLPVVVTRQFETLTMHVFAPVFLAVAGLRLDLDIFLEPQLVLLTLVLLLVASVGKVVGAILGAGVLSGYDTRQSLAFGAALNARGVLGIIVAVIGQSLGIFGSEVYGMIVVTSLATSLLAPPALKRLLGPDAVEPDGEQAARRGYHRVLVPLRLREETDRRLGRVEVSVIGRVAVSPPAATLMTVVDQTARKHGAAFLESVAAGLPRDWETVRRVSGGDPAAVILEEAAGGYDLIVLGAHERDADDQQLFDPVIDTVVRLAPCDTMIFSQGTGRWPPRKILVPTGGSGAAAHAAELAYSLSDESTEVVLFHVLDPDVMLLPDTKNRVLRVSMEVAGAFLADLRATGERAGVSVSTETVAGPRVVGAIVQRASRGIDLVVMGSNVRTGSPRLFLGPKIDRLLDETPCSTIVLNTPLQRQGRARPAARFVGRHERR